MSTTFHLVCITCKRALWVGQRSAGWTHPRLYTKEEYLIALNAFMIAHTRHLLAFTDEHQLSYYAFSSGAISVDIQINEEEIKPQTWESFDESIRNEMTIYYSASTETINKAINHMGSEDV